ncbi:hypothetical protein IW262DRAFT_1456219 [Armillaria fumosa]|nr:hypothetical protein IW262DRAFT_1456219 [Armillaria fumosa]
MDKKQVQAHEDDLNRQEASGEIIRRKRRERSDACSTKPKGKGKTASCHGGSGGGEDKENADKDSSNEEGDGREKSSDEEMEEMTSKLDPDDGIAYYINTHVGLSGALCYAFDLDGIHPYGPFTDDYAEVLSFQYLKLTLLSLEEQLVLLEVLKYLLDDLLMFLKVLGEDQDVVQVYSYFSFVDEIMEDVIHHPLKGCR